MAGARRERYEEGRGYHLQVHARQLSVCDEECQLQDVILVGIETCKAADFRDSRISGRFQGF